MSAVDDYLYKLEAPQRDALQHIRRIVLQIVPDAAEVISYGMPGFKYRGCYLAGYNALKHHLAFYPTSEPIEQLRNELQSFSLSPGTVRFTVDRPIPDNLIRRLVTVRMKSIGDNDE